MCHKSHKQMRTQSTPRAYAKQNERTQTEPPIRTDHPLPGHCPHSGRRGVARLRQPTNRLVAPKRIAGAAGADHRAGHRKQTRRARVAPSGLELLNYRLGSPAAISCSFESTITCHSSAAGNSEKGRLRFGIGCGRAIAPDRSPRKNCRMDDPFRPRIPHCRLEHFQM